jgi:phosphoribosylformylglycinamidine synthase
MAPRVFRKVHEAIQQGLVRACHDLSEGGLAVAVAEMAFAGGLGADITVIQTGTEPLPDEVSLFAESNTRFLLEVPPDKAEVLTELFGEVPLTRIGQVVSQPRLRIAGTGGEWVVWAQVADLKESWQKPLRW